ncbi:MAG: tRNA (N6-isopentenyl adenosine(37)-C2)-methylthiotransferase MiaB [Nitrospinales bacterium]
MKQVYLQTFGCQMNVADTDRMELLLFHSGYLRTLRKEDADLILVNTCSVREKAEHKIVSLLGSFRPLKKSNPGLMLGLTGCLAQQEGDRLVRKFPWLDFVLGPDTVERIATAIDRVQTRSRPLVWTEFDKEKEYSIPALEGPRTPGPSAFVNIIKGCDKFCSFCIVPLTRGREKSREAGEIYAEARQLVRRGAREIILLGQNVNAYGKHGLRRPTAFHELLYGVAAIPGVERLRFTTSHPNDFTPQTVRAYRDLGVLANHLHLPVQCGGDRVLRAMRRGYTSAEYLRLVDDLKSAVPDIALSTDIIVGFPGETDAEFRETLRLMERVGYDSSYMFAYSPRPGTPAENLPDTVPDAVKKERLQTVLELQKRLTAQNGAKYVGGEVEVLIEGRAGRDGADFKGRNAHYWMVHVNGATGALKPGDFVTVKVQEASGHVLKGACLAGRNAEAPC